MLFLTPRILLAASFAAGAMGAIDYSSLPQCAQGPVLNTIGRSKCDPGKTQCLCNDGDIVNDLVALIQKSCTGDDLTKAVAFGNALCPNLTSQSLATISYSPTTSVLTSQSLATISNSQTTPVLTSQSLATTSDSQTTSVLTFDQLASTTDEPATTSEASASDLEMSASETSESASSTAEEGPTVSAPKTSAEAPTASVAAGNGTSLGNGTGPDEFQGHAPEFGPMRLWSMILGMLLMGVMFAEL